VYLAGFPDSHAFIGVCCNDQHKLGRFGKTGYLLQIDQPTNPETGEKTNEMAGTIEINAPIPWNLK